MKKSNVKRCASFLLTLVLLVGGIDIIKVDAADYWMGAYAGRVVLDSGTLNIRKSASTTSERVGYLNNGDYIMLVGTYGGFYKVIKGYCLISTPVYPKFNLLTALIHGTDSVVFLAE